MERKTYCDYLRVAATFAVVVLHVAASKWSAADVNGTTWKAFNFYNSAVRWGVPIFIMISGSLFLNREIRIKSIYSKYVPRMLAAFITWSLFYVLTSPDALQNGLLSAIREHWKEIALGHYHMWFILMISGIYMAMPIFKRIVSDETAAKYYLLLAFLFTFALPWVTNLLTDFAADKSGTLSSAIGIFNTDIKALSMEVVMGYGFFFVLGYYLDRIDLSRRARIVIYMLGIIGFIITVLADLKLSIMTQQPVLKYYDNFSVNVLLEAVSVHTFFKYREYNAEKINSLAAVLSKYSFGAYLIHVFFLDTASQRFGITTLSFNAIASVPVISCAVFVLSMTVSAILNHIPVIKKYCV